MRLASLIRDFRDFCFPPACAVCASPAEQARVPLCPDCLAKLGKLELAAACERCAMPLAEHGAPCPYCLGKGVRPYGRILRLGSYAEPVRDIIHALKFHHAWGLGEFLADRLFARDDVRDLLRSCDAIVPVPLHPFRQMARGYNQAEVIARRLARLARRRLAHPAVRLVHTDAQTDVPSRTQRIANLRHAFGLMKTAHCHRPAPRRGRRRPHHRRHAAILRAVPRQGPPAIPRRHPRRRRRSEASGFRGDLNGGA